MDSNTDSGKHLPPGMVAYLAWALGGFLFAGAILDTVANTYELISPPTSASIFLTSALLLLLLGWYVRKYNPRWHTTEGSAVHGKRLGPKIFMSAVGALIAVVLPATLPRTQRTPAPGGSAGNGGSSSLFRSSYLRSSDLIDEVVIEETLPLDSVGKLTYVGFEARYPRVRDASAIHSVMFNKLVESIVYGYIRENSMPGLRIDYELFNRNGFINVLFFITHTGGAHPTTWFDQIAFDLESGETIELGEMFDEGYDVYGVMEKYVWENLLKIYRDDEELEGEFGESFETMELVDKGWYVTEEGFSLYFAQCSLEACAAGPLSISIPNEVLRSGMTRETMLLLDVEQPPG